MGVDLTLIPYAPGQESSFTLLPLERRSAMWPYFDSLPKRDCPDPFYTFRGNIADPEGEEEEGVTGFGPTTEDRYGETLRYTTARALLDFRELAKTDATVADFLDNNRETWAYLAELPEDTRVALFWH